MLSVSGHQDGVALTQSLEPSNGDSPRFYSVELAAVLFFVASYAKLSAQWRIWLLATIETLLGSSLSMRSFILGKE